MCCMFVDPYEAWKVLETNFFDNSGTITHKDKYYKPTQIEYDAIDFLCDDWDYCYLKP